MTPLAHLRGILVEQSPPMLVLDVHGVGYELEAATNTHRQLPALGQEVLLHTHVLVRDDQTTLYGFLSRDERALFRELVKVNGIGGKLALVILSGLTATALEQAIQTRDSATLMRLPGVGKRLAERLIVELRDRLASFATPTALLVPPPVSTLAPDNAVDEAIQALVALGYRLPEATRLVGQLDPAELSREELIRHALRAALRG